MKTESKETDSTLATQEHCIDLPGEAVQCWVGGGTDKLKVILRKHRDVIFDIYLGNGGTYTLETTDSDFYNVRDKKLVFATRHDKVKFKDGERMHVWVSRGFCGALILKCGDHIISKVKPNEWDTHRHSNDPKEKPAPIIIAIGHSPTASKLTPPIKSPTDAGPHDEQSLHVHDVSKEGAPPAVLKFFEDGGESLQLDSENIITQNWIAAQLAGVAGYTLDNHTWIRELKECNFRLQKVIHKSGPKMYMIFNGNNKIRGIISGSKYSLQHTKIMRITGGAGGVKQGWDTAKGAAKDSLKAFAKEEGKIVIKGSGLAVFFAIAMDVAEWHKDYSEIGPDGKPKKDFYDLLAKVGTDVIKAGLIAAMATATIAAGFTALAAVGATAAAPVLLVVAGTIAVSIIWTYAIEKVDKAIGRTLGEGDTTTWIAKKFREIAEYLSTVSKDVRYENYPMIPII